MTEHITKKLALIGFGPHAQRIYYPYIEDRLKKDDHLEFELLIELASNKFKAEEYLSGRNTLPERRLYLPVNTHSRAPEDIDRIAAEAILSRGITHVIIATEPKAHKAYMAFCISHGIKVLVDKPITSPQGLMPDPRFNAETTMYDAARAVQSDVEELNEMVKKNSGSRVLVQAQRRHHGGYAYIVDLLNSIVRQHNVPITYINIHHSDGMWNMPSELAERENHPYKYGYGKLMHSGYHFVDLLYNLLRINEGVVGKQPDTITLFNQMVCPVDHYEVLNNEDYTSFFGKGDFHLPSNYHADDDLATYGELDSYSQWQFKKDGKVVTTAQMSLMQSGFSLRAWPRLPKDTYKSNGRVRHERVDIHVGPLYNIQVHSYQAAEVGDATAEYSDVGNKNHFDIYVFKNAKLLGGKPLEVIKYGQVDLDEHTGDVTYLGQNEQPRYKLIDELLDDAPSKSELSDHIVTNRLMSMLYSHQAKQQYGQVPYAEYSYKEIFHE